MKGDDGQKYRWPEPTQTAVSIANMSPAEPNMHAVQVCRAEEMAELNMPVVNRCRVAQMTELNVPAVMKCRAEQMAKLSMPGI